MLETTLILFRCTAGGRLGDLWVFDVASRVWSQYPNPPGSARGGSCLTYAMHRLFRYGGFDGNHELGGQIDYLDVSVAERGDAKGEILSHGRSWESVHDSSPGNRSVAGLHPVTTGQGRNYLLLLLGESNPSSSGHDVAGQFRDDVWSYQLQPANMTAASLKDAARRLVGAKTGENAWAKVEVPEASMKSGQLDSPCSRGWFASAPGQDIGTDTVVLWGGVSANNERAGDGWILTIDN